MLGTELLVDTKKKVKDMQAQEEQREKIGQRKAWHRNTALWRVYDGKGMGGSNP